EGEVALVVAAQPAEGAAAEEAGGAAEAEDLTGKQVVGALRLAGALLEGAAVAGQRLPDAVDPRPMRGGRRRRGRVPPALELQDARLHATQPRIGVEGGQERADAARLEHRVGVEDENVRRRGALDAEVDGGGEADVLGQRQVRDAAAL